MINIVMKNSTLEVQLETHCAELVEELQEKTEILELVTESSPIGLWQIDKDQKIKYINPEILQIFNITSSELLNNSLELLLTFIVNKKDKILFRTHLTRIANGKKGNFEIKFQCKNHVKWIQMMYRPIINGFYRGTVGTINDITTKKEILPQLLKLRDEIRADKELLK